jgi:nucleotide-binding universal stress UspA family protein
MLASLPRIVVPVDQSPRSERALPIAAAFARRMKTSMVLVSVVEWPFTDFPAQPGYHERLMSKFPDLEGESVAVRSADDTAAAIVSVCEPTDIICVGADHTSALGEMIYASVFFDLVRKSHRPVIAVGPHAEMPENAHELALCVDGLPHAEQGLTLIPRVADFAGLQPFLLQVIDRKHGERMMPPDSNETAYLHGLGAREGLAHGVGWDVLHGDPTKTITGYSLGPSVAAIGFATDALDPVARFFTPSLANELLKSSHRPLVLVAVQHDPSIERHRILPTVLHESNDAQRSSQIAQRSSQIAQRSSQIAQRSSQTVGASTGLNQS